MLTFKRNYFLLTIVLFLVELFIALFVSDMLFRPFVGDVLVVVLIYCFLRTFLNANRWRIAFGVLLLAFAIEFFQYFGYVKLLGLEKNRILSVAMGRTFEWLDFAAYTVGFLLIVAVEFFYERYQTD